MNAPSAKLVRELVTLTDAAKQHRIAKASLRALVDADRIRYHDRRPHGTAERVTFDAAQLAADLAALPRCQAPHCHAPGTGPTGYCGEHFGEAGRQRAHELERDLLDSERDWYTAKQAASEAPCSLSTLQSALRDGRLAGAQRVGRLWRIPKAELHEWAKGLPPDRPIGKRPRSPAVRAFRSEQIERLYTAGEGAGAIAKRMGCSRSAVHREIKRLGLEHQRRRPPDMNAAERSRRQEHVAQLYRDGHTLQQLAEATGYSVTQVRSDLIALGVERRPSYKTSEHPPPTERPCENCGEPFTPRFPASDRRFHSNFCANEWQVVHAAVELQRRNLLSVADTAAEIWRSEGRVYQLAKDGQLKGELVSYPGMRRPILGFDLGKIATYLTEWPRGGDGRRQRYRDLGQVMRHAEAVGTIARLMATGMTHQEAHDRVLRDAKRRESALGRHRGRQPATGPSELHSRWAERYEHHLADLTHELGPEEDRTARLADLERRRAAGVETEDDRVERRDLRVSIITRALDRTIEEDWAEHPEDWPRPRYPATPWGDFNPKNLRTARARVRAAIKIPAKGVNKIGDYVN